MLRLGAIFIAVCMVLIAASLGAVLYLIFGLSGAESTMVALAALTALALYNAVAARLRDRTDVGAQIADLSRGTADLARQVGRARPPHRRRSKRTPKGSPTASRSGRERRASRWPPSSASSARWSSSLPKPSPRTS